MVPTTSPTPDAPVLRNVLRRLIDTGETRPDRATMSRVAMELLNGQATHAQVAAFLTALRLRGETLDDVVAFARVMRDKATQLPAPRETLAVDLCGTGGDHSGTFNISTAASLVVAAAGVPVVKHGNRAASSHCGSADVLEALGVRITAAPEVMADALTEVGICFLFAQSYHPAMRHVAPVRRELGIPTIFNLLGPLSNPAGVQHQLVGTASPQAFALYPEALSHLGCQRALVVSGEGGMDEITPYGTTRCREVTPGGVREYTLSPREMGRPEYALSDLRGGANAEEAASIVLALLNGNDRGARREAVVLNAAATLYVAGQARTIADAIPVVEAALDSGAAMAKLTSLVAVSQR